MTGVAKSDTRRFDIAAALMVAIGFLLRLHEAATTWLNPDEAQYYFLSLSNNVRDLYFATLQTHHPPLLFFVLHPILAISSSELALRLVPAAAGSAAGWFIYLWLRNAWNAGAGFVAMLILTFSPNLIVLTAQARAYPLELLFAALALWSLDLALEKNSAVRMAAFLLWLYLAILSEYSAAWFACAAGVYFLLRARPSRLSARVMSLWALGQLGALAMYITLYTTSIRPLLQNKQTQLEGFLKPAFPADGESLAIFAIRATLRQFAYAFSSMPMGVLAACFFGAALVLLWNGRAREERSRGRALVALFTTAFLVACAGAIAKVHPYGRTRHTVFLALFIAAATGITVERVLRSRPRLSVAAGLMLALAWLTMAVPDPLDISAARHARTSMIATVDYLRSSLPPGSVVLTTRQTIDGLRYYFGDKTPIAHGMEPRDIAGETRLGSLRVVYRKYNWPRVEALSDDLAALRLKLGLRAAEPVWILDGGWFAEIDEAIHAIKPGLPLPGYRNFDGALVLFQTPPGL